MKIVCYGSCFPVYKRKSLKFDRFRDQYKPVYEANGNRHFEKVGSIDIFALTQSHKDACSIENIIKRATNDPSVLSRTVGQYMDLTNIPTTMQGCFEVINDAKKVFESMPKDKRDTYNCDFSTFLGTFKTAAGLARFLTNEKKETSVNNTVIKEVTENA